MTILAFLRSVAAPTAEAESELHRETRLALEVLAGLPQFVAVDERCRLASMQGAGILNVLTGCLVAADSHISGLRLTWQVGSYDTTAHSFLLCEQGAIQTFVLAMQAQAAQLR